MRASTILGLGALYAGAAVAHPGHDVTEEALERRQFLNSVQMRSLDHCAAKLKARGVEARNVARRSAAVEKSRAAKKLRRRDDLDDLLDTSHNETDTGYTENTSIDKLFSGNASCVLTPEVTQGPYYVGGEYVRDDITEDQEGVEITLDYQVIDVDTCEPVPDVYVEIWHCNSTGVYSGVVASGNGNSDDTSNLDNTFLRGIQPTDSDGVAQIKSLFPGHYTGRATHIHVMVHTNATLYENKTLGNEVYASHVGQTFFDQDLITAIDKISPYSDNTQEVTENADDSILSEEADGVDPFMDYVYLGDDVSSGLFAWLAFGINTSYSGEVTPAAFLYEDGGVENENSGMGGGSGGPGGSSGGAPSGGAGGPPGSNSTGSAAGTPSATGSSSETGSSTGTTSATASPTNGASLIARGGMVGLVASIGGLLLLA